MLMHLVTASLLLTTVIALESERIGHGGADPMKQQLDDRNDNTGDWNPLDEKQAASTSRYGLSKELYDEIFHLVKQCKTMILKEQGVKVTQKDVDAMDFLLYDSVPTLMLAKLCVEQHKRRHKRQIFNFRKYPLRKWPMPIVYKYDGKHDEDAKLMIEAAIKHWESETCIRFKRVDPDAIVTQQHILFTAEHEKCTSHTGRIPQSIEFPQNIKLDAYGCTHKLGLPVHEIGHAIGFWHEHVRPDRDNYVRVNNSYIYSWVMDNFEKLNKSVIDTVNAVPYDYGSVMHYSATEMSMMGALRALKPINPLYLKTMGQRVGLSFFDAKLANLIYCKDKCAGVTPFVRCYNRGYRDPNDCSKCKCPEGFGKRQCRDPAPANGGCSPTSSGIIIVDSTTEHCVSSRNYNQADGKGTFSHGDKCNWLLQASVGRKIMVRFAGPRFSTYCYSRGPSCYQWVEIKYKSDLALRGPRFCCNPGDIPKFDGKSTLTSETNRMMVIFNAEYPLFTNKYSTAVPAHYMMGFKLCYKLATN